MFKGALVETFYLRWGAGGDVPELDGIGLPSRVGGLSLGPGDSS